jgi:hypothetical protein
MEEEPRFTLTELVELLRRERIARGATESDTNRNLLRRLAELREEQGDEIFPASESRASFESSAGHPSLEARLSALEEEVRRLRDRIEGNNG